MKKVILAILCPLLLAGCSQDDRLSEPAESQEVYTVRLNLNGDIQTEDSPLSRAETESRDLYGIQVYKDGKGFAAGMFDNTDNITINLLAGGSYKFVCTAIKEGKDILYNPGYSYGLSGCFYCPGNFRLWDNSNSFLYSASGIMRELNSSYTYYTPTSSDTKRCAEIDRFYGELDGYTPSVNGVVNLELKRVSFGIKVNVSNITDGNVAVKCYNSSNTFVDVSGLTANYESEGKLFSMYDIYNAWQYADSYTENITLDVTWNRGVGVTQKWSKTIQVKRNAMNTVRIKLSADDSDVGVGVTPEGGEMGDEEEDIPLG